MRDAMVAALSLNTFHNYAARVKMTNIAQIANVLQSMVLTKDDKMVLTPTYFVFKMYVPHQDAQLIPLAFNSPKRLVRDNREVPVVSATASTKDGKITISLANTDLKDKVEIDIPLAAIADRKIVNADILTASDVHAHNDFDSPDNVALKPFKDAKVSKDMLHLTLPAMSIVTVTLD